MQSVSNLMNEYFSADSRKPILESAVPVLVEKSTWEYLKDPERMRKSFEFKSPKALRHFVEDLMDFQEEFGHHGKILIDEKTVKVEVYTRGVDRITGLDKEYSKACDEIFIDAQS